MGGRGEQGCGGAGGGLSTGALMAVLAAAYRWIVPLKSRQLVDFSLWTAARTHSTAAFGSIVGVLH